MNHATGEVTENHNGEIMKLDYKMSNGLRKGHLWSEGEGKQLAYYGQRYERASDKSQFTEVGGVVKHTDLNRGMDFVSSWVMNPSTAR